MEPNLRLLIDPRGVGSTEYIQKTGSLLFPARYTRPDILYPVGYLGRFKTHYTPELDKYIN